MSRYRNALPQLDGGRFLADAGVEALVLDSHTSVLEGSALAIPRRLAVLDDDYQRARRILIEAGEELPE